MILNGLGFANRPLSLTPQFFANKPLDLLCREGRRAEMFNRVKLGRTLDEAHAYGCDLWLSELAQRLCSGRHRLTFQSSRPDECCSERRIRARKRRARHPHDHGDSKDHRPDLKQAVLALMVSPDGGVPLVRKSGEGNAADTQMFRERAETLLATLKIAHTSLLGGRHQAYYEDDAANLSQFGLITRIPNTLKLVAPVIQHALQGTRGSVSMRPQAITASSCVMTGWPSAGWWCRRRPRWSAPRPRSAKRVSAKRKPSTSNCFTYKRNALRRLRPLMRTGHAREHVDLSPDGGLPPRRTPTLCGKAGRHHHTDHVD